jgi:anionic cell wall polymer biosynthesis LytR-Cps2A-Psr (LCP) family protein
VSSTVVGVSDRRTWDSVRTDNLVVVDARRRALIWVPRDIWIPPIGNRINTAFARRGFPGLLGSLWLLGLPVTSALVVGRAATERLAADLDVTVPVDEPLRFRYPLAPERPIEDGEQVVAFDPPVARLHGVRVHQWVGARYEVGRPGSDLRRIARQQVFVRALLRQGAPLHEVLARPEDLRRFRDPERVLALVRPDWAMWTLGPVRDVTRRGTAALRTSWAPRRAATRIRQRLVRSAA